MCAFFAHVFPFCDTLLSMDEGRAVAMATLIPCEICVPGQPAAQALYLYSLTTHPDFRGRGHAGKLLAAAREKCDRIFLHAADDSLFAMYAALGWKSAMYARYAEVPLTSSEDTLQPVDGDTYFHLRENALKNVPYVRWNQHTCHFLHAMLCAYDGGLYGAGDAALAVTQTKDGCLYAAEVLSDDPSSLLCAAARQLACRSIRLLTPCHWDDPGAFPMAQTAGRDFPQPLQLSFDFS